MDRSANRLYSRPVAKSSGFAVYHCGQKVYANASAALCHSYIKKYQLKNASVGYA